MNRAQRRRLVAIVAVLAWLVAPAAFAGPGGSIARAVASTVWGKIAMAALAVLLAPVILYMHLKERRAERRCLRDLARVSAVSPAFRWMELKDRIHDCFHRVHAAWRREDMAQAQEWMTDWYWQNQQLAHLDRWQSLGLVNSCDVRQIERIRPLFVALRDDDAAFGGSRVVASVQACMEDYLAERATGRIVEGSRGYRSVTTIWTFVLRDGSWVVGNIEPAASVLDYVGLRNEIPSALPSVTGRRA